MKISDLFAQAVHHHQAGRLAEAEKLYRRILSLDARHTDALHLLGVMAYQTGNLDEAVARYEQALAVKPDYVEALSNLGVALHDQGRLDEAIARYEQALAIKPDYTDALSNFGNALQAQGKLDEAIVRYKKALAIKPDFPKALYNLGCVLQDQNKLDEAIARYEQALAIKPDYADALYNLGCSLQSQGKLDEAAKRYRQTINLDPKNKSAEHLLASITAGTTQRAPSQYIEKLFDDYANKFDAHLVHDLKYKTPAELISLLRQAVEFPVGKWDVLDLGCGTGLAGLEISPYARQLVGVDLSSKMLERAHSRNIYQRLEHSDLLLMMQGEESSSYDVVVAADVFVYLGVLDDIVSEVKRLLRPDGFFIFTVEALEALSTDESGLENKPDYKLNQSGRYAHSANYLEKLSSTNGFSSISLTSIPVRFEKGLPVMAWAAVWKSCAFPQ